MSGYTTHETLVKVEGLSVTKGGRLILNNVGTPAQPLEIKNIVRAGVLQGQRVGILGESGSGKSTLLRQIAGLDPRDSGTVLVDKKDNLVPVQPGMVGFVTQNYHVPRYYRAGDWLKFCAMEAGADKAKATELAEMYMNNFGLAKQKYNYPHELSGGQRQRVCMGGQILAGRQIVALDEPFTGLDPRSKHVVNKTLWDLTTKNDKLTLIIVAHDVKFLMMLCDSIYVIKALPESSDGKWQGATISNYYNLADLGFAWRTDLAEDRGFEDLVKKVTHEDLGLVLS